MLTSFLQEQIVETEREIVLYKAKLEHEIPEDKADFYKTPDYNPESHNVRNYFSLIEF